MERKLVARIVAKDEASAPLRAATQSVQALDRTFTDISRDVRQAAADFRAGKISLDDYTTAVKYAQREARHLSATGIKPVGQELRSLNAITRETGRTAIGGAQGMGTLRSAMGSLAFSTAGLPGRLGEVSSMLAGFSFGSLATAGVFGGIAALGLAYRMLTKDIREAKEQVQAFVTASKAAKEAQASDQEAAARARQQQIRGLLTKGSTPVPLVIPGIGTFAANIPLTGGQRDRLVDELHSISLALQEKVDDRIADEIKRIGGAIEAVRPPGVSAPEWLKSLAPDFTVRPDIRGPGGGGDRSRANVERLLGFSGGMTGAQAAGRLSQVRSAMTAGGLTEADLPATARRIIAGLEELAGNLGDAADDVKGSGRQLVGAMAIAANALAGIITGQSSFLGGLGGLTAGLSNIPALAGFASPLGFASIGFSFFDALTSRGHEDTIARGTLNALRDFEREKPPATIILNVDPFDPTNRRHQRLVDDARRESQAAGYSVSVVR